VDVAAGDLIMQSDWSGHAGTGTATRYRDMADFGVKNQSPSYERICRGVAADETVLALLDGLPHEKRQPNLLLGAARFLNAPLDTYANFRDWLLPNWDATAKVMLERRTQTNEPGRCATLIPGTRYMLGARGVYTREMPVTKRLIEIDDDLLARAQDELGTEGVSDTVRTALRHAASSAARARQVTWLTEGGLADLGEPEQRAAVWR
jgi:Arc/MetJ family transcription regulator